MKIWNEEIQKAIKDKEKAYNEYLQKNSIEAKEQYHKIRNETKAIVRKAHRTSWDMFINRVEHDVHGRQEIAFKLMKHLNREERDTVNLNIIPISDWIKHYKELWYNPEIAEIADKVQLLGVDYIELIELKRALKKNEK